MTQMMYNFSADAQRALEAVERLQAKLKERGEAPTREKLSLLKTVLQSPLFHHILSLQQAQRKPPAKVTARACVCVCGRPVYGRCTGKKVESFPKYSMLEPNWMSNQLT